MKVLPLAEVKAHLSALVSEVELQHEQITITRNGAPTAMVVSVAEWNPCRRRWLYSVIRKL